jgi:hypothetical protein
MAPEITTLIAALGGTLLGGFINFFATRSAKTRDWQLGLRKEKITELTNIYSRFIVSAQTMVMFSIQGEMKKPTELDLINVEFAKIQFLSSPKVIEAAKQICDYVIVAHSDSRTQESRSFFEMKQIFISEARAEISALELVG